MERDSLHGQDQPLSLYKSQNRNPIMEPHFLSRPNYYSFSLSTFPSNKGLLKAPPLSLLHSAPVLSLQPPPPQPPLLPLPVSLPRRSSSCPAPALKIDTGKRRDLAFPHKKSKKSSTSKNNHNIPKKEEKKAPKNKPSDTATTELPKNIARVAQFDHNSVKDVKDRVDMIPGSVVFKISPPPPSSLPLPTFSSRPKLGCHAVAAGVDAGATDDLRRLLRLQ